MDTVPPKGREISLLVSDLERFQEFGALIANKFENTEIAGLDSSFIELAVNISVSFAIVPGDRTRTVEALAMYVKKIRNGESNNIIDAFLDDNSIPSFTLHNSSVIRFNYRYEPALLNSIAVVNDWVHRDIIRMKRPPTLDEIVSAAVYQTGLALIKANAERN